MPFPRLPSPAASAFLSFPLPRPLFFFLSFFFFLGCLHFFRFPMLMPLAANQLLVRTDGIIQHLGKVPAVTQARSTIPTRYVKPARETTRLSRLRVGCTDMTRSSLACLKPFPSRTAQSYGLLCSVANAVLLPVVPESPCGSRPCGGILTSNQ